MKTIDRKEYRHTAIAVSLTTFVLVVNILLMGVFKNIQPELLIMASFIFTLDILLGIKFIGEYARQKDYL